MFVFECMIVKEQFDDNILIEPDLVCLQTIK